LKSLNFVSIAPSLVFTLLNLKICETSSRSYTLSNIQTKKPFFRKGSALRERLGDLHSPPRFCSLRVLMTRNPIIRFNADPSNIPCLFPEDIVSRIPAAHPVRLVNEVVDKLNIDHIVSRYKGGGTTSFHPRMMIKVLFYAYLSNIYSCRKIERALQENIYFMWLSGHSTPDYRTINYFR